MGGAWLVETLWDHYDYTRDTEYLRNTAYPLMKGAADFLLAWLIPNPHNPNELITAPCTSPEADYNNCLQQALQILFHLSACIFCVCFICITGIGSRLHGIG